MFNKIDQRIVEQFQLNFLSGNIYEKENQRTSPKEEEKLPSPCATVEVKLEAFKKVTSYYGSKEAKHGH